MHSLLLKGYTSNCLQLTLGKQTTSDRIWGGKNSKDKFVKFPIYLKILNPTYVS